MFDLTKFKCTTVMLNLFVLVIRELDEARVKVRLHK